MDLVEKMKPVRGQQDSEAPSSDLEGEKDEVRGTSDSTEDAIFEDLDKEKDKIREWWLQSDVEVVVKEEPAGAVFEDEAHRDAGAQKEIKPEEPKPEEPKLEELKEIEQREESEGARLGEEDAFISSLKVDLSEEEDEELNAALREVIEELGNVGAEELLEFGRATLHEITEILH